MTTLDPRAQAIWDAVEARIDAAPIDGISAEGQYSETVFNGQRLYVDGLRAGRLAAIAALSSLPAQAVGKYDDVLKPFVALMEVELHANSGKGDRPGWLAMSREELLLEIYYHLAKLQKAALKNDAGGIREFGADVANMAMMLVDKCEALPIFALAPSQPAAVGKDVNDADV
jgi:hypothetical protein